MSRFARLARPAAAVGVVVAGAMLSARALAGVDWHATTRTLRGCGPSALLVFVPFFVAVSLDSVGVHVLLAALGRQVALRQLLPIRIATEALHMTAPGGFLVADSASVVLLDARCGVRPGEGAVLAIARKWLVTRAHTAYLLLGGALGAVVPTRIAFRPPVGHWLPWAVGASAAMPLVLSLGLGVGFGRQPVFARLQRALSRTRPRGWLGSRSERWQDGASAMDACLARIGENHRATWTATAAFFGAWLVETTETAVILCVLGARFDFALAIAVESGLSLVRSLGNVAPAGLGIQDAGYATLLPAMGLRPEVAAAFVLVKRGKEIAWIGAGYALLALLRRTPTAPVHDALGWRGLRPPSRDEPYAPSTHGLRRDANRL